MEYRVSENISPNKIFLAKYSDLEGRWDPHFYTKYFSDIVNELKKCKSYKKLHQIAHFSSEYWNQKDYYEIEFPYIEIGGINIADGKIDEISYVPVEKAPDRAKVIVRTDDIIISMTRPNRGAIVKITERENMFIASTGFSVIREIDDSVDRDYLLIVLRINLMLEQMLQRSSGGNYPAITQGELGNIIVPIPKYENQLEIVKYYNSANSKRTGKYRSAKDKLSSIDSYLLTELGITLTADTYDLKDRMFTIGFKDAIGNRIDPKFYSKEVKDLKLSILKSPFEKQPLLYFIEKECPGDWGEDENNKKLDFSKYTKCLTLRATEYDNRYNLNLDNSRVKYRYILNTQLKKMEIKPNDLLIEKSGGSEDQPVGRIAFLTEEILTDRNIAYSNFLHKITVKGINPQYLYYYLKLMHNIGLTDSMQSQTNGIRNLIMPEYKNQIIIVPDEQKQTEIVAHISAIRQEAKALETEGDKILADAKEEVEKMVLGE